HRDPRVGPEAGGGEPRETLMLELECGPHVPSLTQLAAVADGDLALAVGEVVAEQLIAVVAVLDPLDAEMTERECGGTPAPAWRRQRGVLLAHAERVRGACRLEFTPREQAESGGIPEQSAGVIGERREGAAHREGAVAGPRGEHRASALVLGAAARRGDSRQRDRRAQGGEPEASWSHRTTA